MYLFGTWTFSVSLKLFPQENLYNNQLLGLAFSKSRGEGGKNRAFLLFYSTVVCCSFTLRIHANFNYLMEKKGKVPIIEPINM